MLLNIKTKKTPTQWKVNVYLGTITLFDGCGETAEVEPIGLSHDHVLRNKANTKPEGNEIKINCIVLVTFVTKCIKIKLNGEECTRKQPPEKEVGPDESDDPLSSVSSSQSASFVLNYMVMILLNNYQQIIHQL